MGYHDVNPVVFITNEAFKDTNTSEDACKYGEWLEKNMKKARAMLDNTALKDKSDIAIKSSDSISNNSE